MQFNVKNAQAQLRDLISKAKAGEEIIITTDDTEVQLVPKTITSNEPRKPGALKGQIKMADDFDEWSEDFAFPFGKAK